jgi:hypothetical protein
MNQSGGKPQHVILVNSTSEIQEWDSKEEAHRVAELFNTNSEQGYEYIVKEI